AGELLLLGVGLAGRRGVALALGHEALERGARELLVRRIGLAGGECRCRRDQTDGESQCDCSHGLLLCVAKRNERLRLTTLVQVVSLEKRRPIGWFPAVAVIN